MLKNVFVYWLSVLFPVVAFVIISLLQKINFW